MTAPEEPGAYEIRYQLERGNRVMAQGPLEVLAPDAALDDGAGLQAPATGKPGEVITISWSGGSDSADAIFPFPGLEPHPRCGAGSDLGAGV
ncbi:hypothetical protein [Pseudogemmobacter faecipullorum]|uniref:hypothetical protein n=1 Tax=Pseudogemmobacter faecipullorum TaxID=2755041 RepID=UPI001D01BE03|nr:hypothetical protein [Pseudogemmobacter faecipullorum]